MTDFITVIKSEKLSKSSISMMTDEKWHRKLLLIFIKDIHYTSGIKLSMSDVSMTDKKWHRKPFLIVIKGIHCTSVIQYVQTL